MRILAVADVASEYLWGPGVRKALEGIDLILSCGDLPPSYLEYLTTFTGAPLLYVHGNHDTGPEPEGCECIDGKLVRCKGLRILGLGGSIRYNAESRYQYTQEQMRNQVWKLGLSICRHRGFDILLTHAGGLGVGDGDDRAHEGFAAFTRLLDRWTPPFMVHGHTHLNYGPRQKRLSYYKQTQIINAFERYVFDVDTPAPTPKRAGKKGP